MFNSWRSNPKISLKDSESWHADYKDSAYVYAGGLPFELTEGDVVCIFSQYGEILDVNLVRDKKTGKSKGFAFLKYEDQRSTILAVDNFAGSKVLGRSLRVDHVGEYKQPKRDGENGEDWEQDPRASMNVAPIELFSQQQRDALRNDIDVTAQTGAIEQDYTQGIDPEDPMFEYLVNERREAAQRRQIKHEEHNGSGSKERSRSHRSSHKRERSPRRRNRSRSRDRDDKERRRESHRNTHRYRSKSP